MNVPDLHREVHICEEQQWHIHRDSYVMHGQAETFLLEKMIYQFTGNLHAHHVTVLILGIHISLKSFKKLLFNAGIFYHRVLKSILFSLSHNFYVLKKFIKRISTFITNNFYAKLTKKSFHDIIFFF